MIKFLTIKIIAHIVCVCLISSVIKRSLGKNPRKGGSPPIENILMKILVWFRGLGGRVRRSFIWKIWLFLKK